MRNKFLLPFVICLTAAIAAAQKPSGPPAQVLEAPQTAVQQAARTPTDSDMYCAGFFSRDPLQPGLAVLGGVDGLRNEYGDRDIVYLDKGTKWIKAPGGKYMLVRPIKDTNPIEAFPGQRELVLRMGTLYAEIARIEIQIVHAESATAEILHACQPVLAGDIAIPLQARPAPPFRAVQFTDRFSPASGKTTGLIAAIKEFNDAAGEGDIVYLNRGSKQGLRPGEYVRIFRTYLSPSQSLIQLGTRNYLTDVMGVPIGRKLTPREIESLPRTVVGELMILFAQDQSSTAIVTYSWEDIYPGDQFEVE